MVMVKKIKILTKQVCMKLSFDQSKTSSGSNDKFVQTSCQRNLIKKVNDRNDFHIYQTGKCSPFSAIERRGRSRLQGPSGDFLWMPFCTLAVKQMCTMYTVQCTC